MFCAVSLKKNPLATVIPPEHLFQFNVVSCQFALHYSFENETKARQALQNISQALAVGGHFFGTCPNSNWIVYMQLQRSSTTEKNYDPSKDSVLETLCIPSHLIKRTSIRSLDTAIDLISWTRLTIVQSISFIFLLLSSTSFHHSQSQTSKRIQPQMCIQTTLSCTLLRRNQEQLSYGALASDEGLGRARSVFSK